MSSFDDDCTYSTTVSAQALDNLNLQLASRSVAEVFVPNDERIEIAQRLMALLNDVVDAYPAWTHDTVFEATSGLRDAICQNVLTPQQYEAASWSDIVAGFPDLYDG